MNFQRLSRFIPLSILAIPLLHCGGGLAQEIPVPPRIDSDEDFNRIIEKFFPDLDKLDPLSIPGGADQSILNSPEAINIKSVRFSGNQAIRSEDINSVLSIFEGRSLPPADLNKIEQAVLRLYQEQGFSGSGAFISEQSYFDEDGLNIHLQILEVRISEVVVNGAGRLAHYIRKKVSPLKNEVLNDNKLLTKIRFLLLDERIDDIAVTITSTKNLAQKTLILDVEPARAWNVLGLLNNSRSPSVGSFERGISASHSNVLGYGDKFSLDYRNTDGSDIVGVGYEFPLTARTTLDFDYLFGDSEIISDPFQAFDIETQTQSFGLGVTHSVMQRSSDRSIQEFLLGLGFARTENKDRILDTPFPVTEGADSTGRIRSSRLDFSQEYSKRTRKNQVILESIFGFGLDLGTTNEASFGNGEFFKWSGQGLFAQKLTDRVLMLSRARLQLADRDLIGNELISLGGRNLRGFVNNQVARTNGINLSQEFRFTAFEDKKHQIDLSAFFDFGAAWNVDQQINEPSEELVSLGLGLTYQFEGLRAALEYGFPLFGPQAETKSLQGDGLLLSLQFRF